VTTRRVAASPAPLLAPLLSPLLVLTGCVQFAYQRVRFDAPVADGRLDALRPGADTLASCLASLGAPHRAFEYQVAPDRSSGMALLWYWKDARGWGLEFSSPSDDVPVSLDLSLLDDNLRGCMLWFTSDLVLERVRRGRVSDLLPARVRPSAAGL
jgi:hypothetical protein